MAYATETEAKAAYAGEGANPTRLAAVMGSASGMVRRIAPPPAPEPADYAGLASSAEILAGEYFWAGGALLKRSSVLDQSKEFTGRADIEAAVADIMGDYASDLDQDQVASEAGDNYSLEVASTFESP